MEGQHLALYRQYRPQTFDKVIGQNHIVKTLCNQVANQSISHAYLFTGTRGIGKTSCAKIFARAINCEHPINGSPCNECATCKGLSEANNTDIIEMDAASNNRVDEIRDLREKVKYPPIIGKKKVYIIDEVHMLTDSAFNALLKTLEEPPSHAVFILATTEIHKLPATILSRCMRFDFNTVSIEELQNLLKEVFAKSNIRSDDKSLYAIAKAGEGSVRDMLSIADSVAGFCDNDISIDKALEVMGQSSMTAVYDLMQSLIEKDIAKFFKSVDACTKQSKNISILCRELSNHIKTLIMLKNGVEDAKILNIMPEDIATLKVQSEQCEINSLLKLFEKISAIELDLKYSINPQILFESTCLAMLQDETIQKSEQSANKMSTNDEKPAKIAENVAKTEIVSTPLAKTEQEYAKVENANDEPKLEQTVENKESEQEENERINIEQIWGRVLIGVKEQSMFALSSALKTCFNVKLENGTVVIYTNDKHSIDIINEHTRKEVVFDMLKRQSDKITNFEVRLDENTKTSETIIKDLSELFGDKLKIEE